MKGMEHTIDATLDPDIAMFVPRSSISSVEVPRIGLHIRVDVPLVIPEDRPGNRRPWTRNAEDTFDIVTIHNLRAKSETP